jgi:hypothetical protein
LRGVDKDTIRRGHVIAAINGGGDVRVDSVGEIPGGVRVQGIYTAASALHKGDRRRQVTEIIP